MMDVDLGLVAAASEVLEQGSCKVYKSTRAGFTTSAVLAAMELNRQILVVSPTKKILSETVMRASGGQAIAVQANSFCPMLQEQVRQDTFLKRIPLPLPDCQECYCLGNCPVTEILERDDPPVISITYSKLNALMLSRSEVARRIRKKLSRVDVVLLDESHAISLPSAARVQAFYSVSIPEGYPILTDICHSWIDLCNNNLELLQALKAEGDAGHVGKHLSKLVPISDPLHFKRMSAAWSELLSLTQRREELGLKDDEILAIRDIISIIGGWWVSVSYIREKEGAEGNISLSGNVGTFHYCLREFLSMHVPNADHIFSSATLIEPTPKFFESLSGRFLKDIVFPDLRNTNSKMQIYPDRWRLNSRNFARNFHRIMDRIVKICTEEKRVYILAPNARKASAIRRRLREVIGAGAPDVDFYRSDLTMGVERNERVCIAVGLAELPTNAYDHLAVGKDHESRWLHSQALRIQSVQAASWQAWSRVKDPKGKEVSKVYCIGVRADQVSDTVAWGGGRRVELKEIKESKTRVGDFRTPKFDVKIDILIEPPRIFREEVRHSHRERHNIRDYIERVELNGVKFINSQNVHKVPIISNRQNVQILGIYNNPGDESSLEVISGTLYSLFVTRTDCYAEQSKVPDSAGRYSYFKRPYDWEGNLQLIKNHLDGKLTLGTYQISLSNQVKWICFDLDNHDGSNPNTRTDVDKLLSILDRHAIPYLLEASGSPDSFHVWIFLLPAGTHSAYCFSRQIAFEAGIRCEIFPKQKGLGKNSKFGNLIKLPLGINRKTGVRSQFLDPRTFQPYESDVPLPGLVKLFEVREGERKRSVIRATRAPKTEYKDFRPCIKAIIDTRVPLEGSEGHTMRVAIAVEAFNIGMGIESTVDLLQYQPDFDRGFTRSKVSEIHSRAYSRFSCEKLRDQCGSLVSNHCSRCPLISNSPEKVISEAG